MIALGYISHLTLTTAHCTAEPEEGEEGYLEDGAQHPVSRSYEWLLAVLTHLSGEYAYVVASPQGIDESTHLHHTDR